MDFRNSIHWKTDRLKALFAFGKGALPITKENLVDEGIPVVSYGQIHENTTLELQLQMYHYFDMYQNLTLKEPGFIGTQR